MDKVEFFLDGNNFPHIKSYSIKYDLFQSAGSFTADIEPDYVIPLGDHPVDYDWKINDVSVQHGYVDKVEKSYSKGSQSHTISGRDMAQVMIDNYIQKPNTYTNRTVKQIIADIMLANLGVDMTEYDIKRNILLQNTTKSSPPKLSMVIAFSDGASQVLDRQYKVKEYRTDYGQTFHDAIATLLKQFNLVIYNQPGTNVMLVHMLTNNNPDPNADHTPAASWVMSYGMDGVLLNDDPYPISNLRTNNVNNNVISCNWTNDITSFASWVKLVLTSGSESDFTSEGEFKTQKQKMKFGYYLGEQSGFAGVLKYKCLNFNYSDLSIFERNIWACLGSIMHEQYRNLYQLSYVVSQHSPRGGYPYMPNHIVVVNDDEIPMYNADWLIYAVEFTGSKDRGMQTKLDLAWPASADGFIFDTYNKIKPGTALEPRG